MSQITMPSLSDSMEEGTLLRWLARDGDTVSVGDELLEVETDKATMTVAAEVSGVLRILVEEGTSVSVGTVIGEAVASGEAAVAPAAVAPAAAPMASAAPVAAVDSPVPPAPSNGHAGLPASTPLARRTAREHGVDLHTVTGSGPRGRITRGDVLAATGAEPAPPRVTPDAAPPPPRGRSAPAPAGADGEPVTLTRTQALIARRMSESRTTIPEFEVQTEVAMDAVVALRTEIRAQAGEGEPVPSLNDFVVRASAVALRRHPPLAATWRDDAPVRHTAIDIGVAVARDDALVVPVVRGVDALTLGELATETRRLAEAVRAGSVSAEELSGGTFTVSNLGMFGMTAIRPIINAPQVAILGVGAVRDTLALVAGEVVARRLMTLTLSCDHRAVYGADAARFLSEVRELLEAPLRLVL